MTIEIHQPELENLIRQRMKSGAFRSVEDVLLHDLKIAAAAQCDDEPTGAGLAAAMQSCPLKDINIEPERFPMPVRDISF